MYKEARCEIFLGLEDSARRNRTFDCKASESYSSKRYKNISVGLVSPLVHYNKLFSETEFNSRGHAVAF